MILNFLVIAFRNIIRNKLFTSINVFGLAVGIASVSIIMVYINHELSYDKFHDSAENIYRIAWFGGGDSPQTRVPHPMAQAMVNDFPEVESAVSITPLWGPGLIKETFSVNNPENDDWFDEKEILAVDTTFFKVFSFEMLLGDKVNVLKRPDIILITESTAVKYFGENWREKNLLEKFLSVNDSRYIIQIGGVLKDPPKTSHFHFDFLVSYIRLKTEDPDAEFMTWADFGHFNYIKLKEGSDSEALERKLIEWVAPHINADQEAIDYFRERPNVGFQLQRITDIHLHSRIRWELEANGNIAYVYIMSAAALFILIIAAFNFMNLTTAQSANRSKEIGIRKSLGARQNQVRFQFIMETTVLAAISVIMGGFLAEISLPFFESLTGNTLDSSLLYTPIAIGSYVLIILFLGFMAGLYPAFVLARVNIRKVLKGEFVSGKKGHAFRSTLVVIQFAIAMILISGSMVIFNQLIYLQNKSLGFNKEEKVVIPMMEGNMRKNYPTMEKELLRLPGVSSVAAVSNLPGGQFNQQSLYAAEHPEHIIDASEMICSHDFLNLMDIKIIEGRGFDESIITDSIDAFILNKEAVEALNLKDPIGNELVLDMDGFKLKGSVIGITENFHYLSLHDPIRPLIVIERPWYNHLIINVGTEHLSENMNAIRNIWQEHAGNFRFSYNFLDQNIDAQYRAEKITGKIFGVFSGIAVVIACLGLFSMATINMERRKKEVGVRKILGASKPHILFLLLGEFSKIILLALLLAAPIGWFMMDNWLNNFTYHINLTIQLFVGAAILVVFIAWLTISGIALKTLAINPTEALKSE